MKAWEYEARIRRNAEPRTEQEGSWSQVTQLEIFPAQIVKAFWQSNVPGSDAPECLIAGAIQSVENMGKDVSEAESLFETGLRLLNSGEAAKLKTITSLIFKVLREAKTLTDHPYHTYERPLEWTEISADFPDDRVRIDSDLYDKILGGWLGQIAGASMGTKLEGYTGEALERSFGKNLGYYIDQPDTFNDDITYEIAFLEALRENEEITSVEIALKWLELIPFGWSAEYIALENLKMGIFPPESGIFNNPFQEWIGAQMRCMVHGLLRPARPKEAAYLAYLDSQISHSGNGVYGGIHSAVMTSLAFVHNDIRKIIEESTKYVPNGSEFSHVLNEIIVVCEKNTDWRQVRKTIQRRFEKYNWIHVYPNLCCVIASLWYGKGDFDETMKLVSAMGYDVDCNAGEVGTILGVMKGSKELSEKWVSPLKDCLQTYLPGFEKIRISELAKTTTQMVKKADLLFLTGA